MLTLPEELVLLALDEQSGSISSCHARLQFALAGAVLADLLLSAAVRIEAEHIIPVGPPPSDPTSAAAFDLIRAKEQSHSVRYWVDHLDNKLGIRDRAVHSLAARGIIHREDRHFLVFHYERYPLDELQVREDLRVRLLRAVTEATPSDERSTALAALAEPCGLLRLTFGPAEWNKVKDRATHLTRDWPISAAVLHAAEEMETAIVASTIAITG